MTHSEFKEYLRNKFLNKFTVPLGGGYFAPAVPEATKVPVDISIGDVFDELMDCEVTVTKVE